MERAMMPIPFQNTYARLPERFFSRQDPAVVPQPAHIRVNAPLALELGIDPTWLESAEGLAVLCGNAVAEGSEPLAQAYAGHQFGGFVPQLGDGRTLLLGEVRGRDIQLKGSGRTAYSRGGDGKAALGPALREYLISEAMHGLGIPATRALAVVRTGEKVERETPLDGAVFTRVAASHLRVGTFEYFSVRDDTEALRVLADFAIARHYPAAAKAANPPLALLESVITAQASLIARWMGVGFIHGVMNTDNCSISGETIDFGPCAFMDVFHPRCVFSAIDRQGRYAWTNQPVIAEWNLTRLAETLLPLIADNVENAVPLAEAALAQFGLQYARNYHAIFCDKLGISHDHDGAFIIETLTVLANQQVDFTRFFRFLTSTAAGLAERKTLAAEFQDAAGFDAWFSQWRHITGDGPRHDAMCASNPICIPRNHRVEQAIQSAYRGDFAPFHRLADAWQNPFAENADLERAPLPEEVVRRTFCGT